MISALCTLYGGRRAGWWRGEREMHFLNTSTCECLCTARAMRKIGRFSDFSSNMKKSGNSYPLLIITLSDGGGGGGGRAGGRKQSYLLR